VYQHILLPVDGSPASQSAARAGIALARRIGAHVTALHVLPEPARVGLDAWAHADQRFGANIADSLEARGERYTGEVREAARQSGVACECRVLRGASPHAAILAEARKSQCDLIVMGSHGTSGAGASRVDGEAVKVVTLGEVPVLVHHGPRGSHLELIKE
jgi:nucleotide-binding universal stress UspA family protein